MSKIQIKVCGMRESNNINELLNLQPDYIGFILYPGSKRYVGDNYRPEVNVPSSVKKVGVFVDALISEVVARKSIMDLDFVQLHGSEPPEYCKEVHEMGIKIIKAFGVTTNFEFDELNKYAPYCDYFLFDTQTPIHGGSGQKFNWEILNNYSLKTPFFLSGGIKPCDAEVLCNLKIDKLFAIDINSGFETAPAQKDIHQLKHFINTIRTK